jgi:short-subunit dehydrogenase
MTKQTKTILITGATAGIGRAAALYLAERGHRVIATGRRDAQLASLAREAAERGVHVDTLRLDVTDGTSIAAAKLDIGRLLGGRSIDVLVNNAGFGLGAPLIEATDADLRRQFDTNVFGLMAVTRAFARDMMAAGSGRIINVSSVGGRMTFPMMGAYHASKYAVEALSDALRMELKPFGIDVSLIEPGPINTEFVDRMNATAESYRDASAYSAVFARTDVIEKRAMSMAPGPDVISRAIHRAATARRPKARYIAPLSSALMLRVLSWIPTRLRDAMIRSVFGLDRRLVADRTPILVSEAA